MLKLLASLVALLTVISLFITGSKFKNSYSQNKPFPKKQVIITVIGAAFVIMVVIYEHYFFTFDRIDRENAQQGLGPIMSPNGGYEAISYYEPYGGAAGGVNVWVEVKDVNKDSVQVIYYGDASSHFSMKWLTDEKLSIINEEASDEESGGSVELRINKEIYHDAGLACRSLIMKKDYEICYQQ